jgi:hypothetical protein
MKLKELIEQLSKFDPELEVIYSVDEEGNGFGEVNSIGGLGMFNDDEFISKEHYEADPEYYKEEGVKFKVNALCIN